jgi:hypothetical protein
MKENLALLDRMIRTLIGFMAALLCYQGYVTGYAMVILLLVAAYLGVTAFVGSCPLYSMLGIKSIKKRNNSQ